MSKTILLIEDNLQNLYLETFLLERHGFNVVSERDGMSAIKRAAELVPALILLDIQLPVMDGYSVARAIRGIDALKDVPIVAVTSYAMVGDREKCLAAGCNGYIEKPIDPDSFVAEIARFQAAPDGTDHETNPDRR